MGFEDFVNLSQTIQSLTADDYSVTYTKAWDTLKSFVSIAVSSGA